MKYYDGYEGAKLTKTELPKNTVRAYALQNGDVITICGKLFQFENGKLYSGRMIESLVNPTFKRDGTEYTPDELKDIWKKG